MNSLGSNRELETEIGIEAFENVFHKTVVVASPIENDLAALLFGSLWAIRRTEWAPAQVFNDAVYLFYTYLRDPSTKQIVNVRWFPLLPVGSLTQLPILTDLEYPLPPLCRLSNMLPATYLLPFVKVKNLLVLPGHGFTLQNDVGRLLKNTSYIILGIILTLLTLGETKQVPRIRVLVTQTEKGKQQWTYTNVSR